MLAFSMLVAGSFALGALAANHVAPIVLNALRFWIAAAILCAVVLARGGVPAGAAQAPWRYLVLGGTFGLYFVLMFEGLKTAAPVSAAAVFTLTPAMSAVFGWLLLRQQVTLQIALALTLGGLGALWVIFRADLAALLAFEVGRGEAIYFLGCIAHALFTPMSRWLNRGEPALVFAFGATLGGAITLTLAGWPALRSTDYTALPGIVWITLAYTSVFASAVTVVLLQYAALVLPSSKVMAYTYLVPAWVILWTVGLGAAWPPVSVALGVAMIVAALVLLLRDGAISSGPAAQAGPNIAETPARKGPPS